jgi:hypothetical protein
MSTTSTVNSRGGATEALPSEEVEKEMRAFQDAVNTGDLETVIGAEMLETAMIDRRLDFEDVSDRLREAHTPPFDLNEALAGGDALVQAWTPRRNIGAKGSWVTLDAYWGKRLGAHRNGRVYRLPRREFVRKMAELDHSSSCADPQASATSDGFGTPFEVEISTTATSERGPVFLIRT